MKKLSFIATVVKKRQVEVNKYSVLKKECESVVSYINKNIAPEEMKLTTEEIVNNYEDYLANLNKK